MKKIIIALVAIGIIAGAGFIGYTQIQDNKKMQAVDEGNDDIVIFSVQEGDDAATTLNKLQEEGLIYDAAFAYEYVIENGSQFYVNDYALKNSMTLEEIIEILCNPTSNITEGMGEKLVITEGGSIDEIAENIETATNGSITADEAKEKWNDESYSNELIDEYWFLTDEILNEDIIQPLEGYFTPATFIITEDQTIEEMTKMMLDTTSTALEPYKDVDYPNDFTLHEILTLSSIIERETILEEDKKPVSGVFYNRFEEGMPMQSDITVLYAKGIHKAEVLYSDLEEDSPYNTYMYEGLTPGPIASPSISSVDAAINPEDNDYLYFFAEQESGKTHFSKTLDEHQEITEEYAWEL